MGSRTLLAGLLVVAAVVPGVPPALPSPASASASLPAGGAAGILTIFDGPSARGKRLAVLPLRGGKVDLADLVSAFSLRSSLDILGERVDLVGPGGSCRLLLDSPLVLSRGLFAVLSAPMEAAGERFLVPRDFLSSALPALLDRRVRVEDKGTPESPSLVLGTSGSGGFHGVAPEELDRVASFIERPSLGPTGDPPAGIPSGGRESGGGPAVRRGLETVVLDPGHGGVSPGARGGSGLLEKELVLSVAERLKKLLEEGMGVKVVLTRTADYYVGLKERTAIANNNRADLFLSIHANAAFTPDTEGVETYTLSFSATDGESGKLAEAENRALGVAGAREEPALLEAILWDMAQTDFLEESRRFAGMAQKSLLKALGGPDRGVRRAPLAVLMGARSPAAVVEIGFLTNPGEELRLTRETHRDKAARALFEAVAEYARLLSLEDPAAEDAAGEAR